MLRDRDSAKRNLTATTLFCLWTFCAPSTALRNVRNNTSHLIRVHISYPNATCGAAFISNGADESVSCHSNKKLFCIQLWLVVCNIKLFTIIINSTEWNLWLRIDYRFNKINVIGTLTLTHDSLFMTSKACRRSCGAHSVTAKSSATNLQTNHRGDVMSIRNDVAEVRVSEKARYRLRRQTRWSFAIK